MMRKWLFLMLISSLVSTVVVFTALHIRQTPFRSGTDAYLPMRTLMPIEGAALLKAEDARKPSEYSRTVITDVDQTSVGLLTRDYPIRVSGPTQTVSESHGSVEVSNQTFRLVSNSWESYVSYYKVPRKPIEALLGTQLGVTPAREWYRSRFNEDKISFSSERIPVYVVTEIVLLTVLMTVIVAIFWKSHWLLWLPGVAAVEFLLFITIIVYSPAFLDADWFHQRVVIEDAALLLLYPFFLVPYGLFLVPLSFIAYLFMLAYRSHFIRRTTSD